MAHRPAALIIVVSRTSRIEVSISMFYRSASPAEYDVEIKSISVNKAENLNDMNFERDY